jgi:hypothetical protein
MDVQIFDHDGRDNSILYNFAHSGRQKAIVAARFSCFERAQIFEASFSTELTRSGHLGHLVESTRMVKRHPFPEVYCDLNARMIERGYSLERQGSVHDLDALGLTLESAVGMRFTFVMDDADDDGNPDDIMFNGVVVHDAKWGFLALADDDFVYWRSQIEG